MKGHSINIQSEIILYQTQDNQTALEVKFESETIWLTQQKIADLRVKATTGAAQQKRTLILTANNLQFQKVAAETKLAALGKASGTDWDQQKADLDRAMANLRKACENAGVPLK